MLTLAAAFVFSVYTDPFTDEQTYRARAGDLDRGPGLVIECTNERRPKWVVRIFPNASVAAEFLGYGPVLTRVDSNDPKDFPARYEVREVVLEYNNAETFVHDAANGERLVIGLRGTGDRRIDMSLPLDGAAQAIAQVRERCLS